jgi:hypothetical protein
MIAFLQNPLKSVFSAWKKSLPSNWFLKGDDRPYSGQRTAISDPYAQSSWIYAAINLIAQPIKAAKVRYSVKGSGEAIEDEALAAFWSSPARGVHEPMDFEALIENTVTIRKTTGGAFWLLDDSWENSTQALRNPIILAAPCHMTPIWDGRTLDGWAYRDGRGKMISFSLAQVIHLKLPNPGDPDSLDGIPPCMPARESAEAARAGAKFARRVMDQNGDRGNFLIAKHALSQPQIDMLRAELAEKRRAADEGKYRDSVIGGDVEIVPNPISAVTTGFVGQVAMSRDEIFVAYDVPPSMAQAMASYSIGSASDQYRLINGACTAESKDLAKAIARVSEYVMGWRSMRAEIAGRPSTGRSGETRRIAVEFDFSSHPVMAEVRASRVGELGTLFKMGMPIEKANAWLGLGLPEYDGWDERWMPSGMIPIDEAMAPAPTPAEKTGEDLETLVRSWSAKRSGLVRAKQEAVRLERWKRVDATRERDRKRMKAVITRHAMAARAETLRKLAASGIGEKSFGSEYQVRAGVLDLVFDLTSWVSGLWGDLSKMLGGMYRTASEQVVPEIDEVRPDDLGDYDPLSEADPRVIEQLNRRQNLIKGASDDLYQTLIASLEEGVQAGETQDQLTGRVKGVFNDFNKVRAETIARTEVGAAYENARYLTMVEAGITQKGWLSGGEDGVTRPTHQAADGQRRRIDEAFEVGEARLMHPHDQIGGEKYPEELINCRCVLTAEG